MKRILLADDNPHIREFCKQQLERDDVCVVLASNGLEAIHVAQREPVDLAILDIGMPIIDGYEAAARIRAIAPELPILFFSNRPIARPALTDLAAASIEKSDDLTELNQAVSKLLGGPVSANDTVPARPR